MQHLQKNIKTRKQMNVQVSLQRYVRKHLKEMYLKPLCAPIQVVSIN